MEQAMSNCKNLTAPADKIMTLEQAVKWRESLRSQGIELAVTNGCFDLLHRGHVDYLCKARQTADALLVLVNSDASVRALKGPSRPVNEEYARAFVLAGLAAVDAVVIFDSQRCTAELAALKPDVYAKGGDYTVETLDPDEREALLSNHARIEFIAFVDGYSTTGTIKKMNSGKQD